MSALTSLTGASPRTAPAGGTTQTGSGGGLETGFAGLITQFSVRPIDAQAEATAPPSLQDPLSAAGTALDDTLSEDSTAPADTGLLAALGLLPLPGVPEPAPLPATLFGGLMPAAPTATPTLTSADAALAAAADPALAVAAGAREATRLPPAAASAALAGAISMPLGNAGAADARQTAVALPTQATAPSAAAATTAFALPPTTAATAATTATAATAATTTTAAAPILAALNTSLEPAAAEPEGATPSLQTPTPALSVLNPPAAPRTAPTGSAVGLAPEPDAAASAEPSIDLAAVLKLSGETVRTETKTDPASSRIAAPGSALSFDRADLLSALRDSVTQPASLNPPPSAPLDPRSAGFGVTLGQQMVWLAEQKVGRAEIRLDPEELGPLEVSLELDGDEIRAEFGSRSAEVRSLLESQVPRLREMLAEHGFSLADAQIGQERHAQQQSFTDSGGAGGLSDAGVDANEASPPATTAVRVRQGLVDDYA